MLVLRGLREKKHASHASNASRSQIIVAVQRLLQSLKRTSTLKISQTEIHLPPIDFQ